MKQSRATLKQYFEKKDKPTQGQFSDLIDSFVNIEDAGMVGVLYPKLQWLTATEYVQGDIVYDAGNSYLCRVDHTSEAVHPEADSTNWMKLVAKGDNAYLYVAYASDSSGTDFTLTFDANLDYIAILNSEVAIPSPSVEDFVGLWKKYKGDQGIQGLAASISIGTVTTLPPGSPATVENVGTDEDAILNIGIPAGEDGEDGTDGLITQVVAGSKIAVDNTDPAAPVVSLELGEDDNFMTDTEKANSHAPGSDDQDLSVLIPKSIVNAKGDIVTATEDNTPARLAVGTNGYVLTADSNEATGLKWASASGGTSLWTAITGTRASNTTIKVATDKTAIFKKGMIVRWKESGVDKVGMVSIPSTYSSPNTTITIIGDTCASIDANSFKYSVILGVEPYIAKFAIAGNIGATATDVANAYYATEPMKVIGADLQAGTAGTTNNTTIDINKGGTTMFTTKPTLATTVASSPTPFTADTTSALALGDRVSIDIDAVQTTNAIDLYVQLYLFPLRFLTLS